MTERDFCYWLQGFLELSGPGVISERQKSMIAEHLALVMRKETPTYSLTTPVELDHQKAAQDQLRRAVRDGLPSTRLIC